MAEKTYAKIGVAGGTGGSADTLRGRTFVSTSVAECGVPRLLVPGTQIRLHVTSTGLSAEAGCNILNCPLTVEPSRLVTGEAASTRMGCAPEREAQDRWLAEFLGAGPSWAVQDGLLTLTVDDTAIVFTELDGEPTELWGLTFTSVSVSETGIVPAPVVEGTTIRLTFTAPDNLTAQAGCNILGFHVVIDESRLTVADEVSSTRMSCPDDLLAQDRWLTTFLTDDPCYAFTGSMLTLTRASTEIVFVREVSPG